MRIRRRRPRSDEYEPYNGDDLPYLVHGNVGWNDEVEARKKAKRVKPKPFPTGFSNHESVARQE